MREREREREKGGGKGSEGLKCRTNQGVREEVGYRDAKHPENRLLRKIINNKRTDSLKRKFYEYLLISEREMFSRNSWDTL